MCGLTKKTSKLKYGLAWLAALFFHALSLSAQPQFKLDSTIYHLAAVPLGEDTHLKIPFTNGGDEALIVIQANSSNDVSTIGCTNEPIAAGAFSNLEVSIQNNRVGTFTHHFVVKTNASEEIIPITVQITVVGDPVQRTVKGTIVDVDGNPVIGATVMVEGSRNGTMTDVDGKYRIQARSSDYLIFTLVGFNSRRIIADRDAVDCVMFEAENQLKVDLPFDPNIGKMARIDSSAVTTISARDLKHSNSPRYTYKKNAKRNVYVIYVTGTSSWGESDVNFQKKYNVLYSSMGEYSNGFARSNNKRVFRHLRRHYSKEWKSEIRIDAVDVKEGKK